MRISYWSSDVCSSDLIGNTDQIRPILDEEGAGEEAFEFVHTNEFISMADHPTKAIAQKATASIPLGFQLLKEGHIDAFASAGNTGAMLVGAMISIKIGRASCRERVCQYV